MPPKSSGTPQRPAGVRLHPLLQARDVGPAAHGEGGVDPAGEDGVHLDVVLGPGGRQRLAELDDAALAGGVGRGERQAEDRCHRADHDDLAAARLAHGGVGRMRADEGAGEVGLEDQPPLVERVGLRRLAHVDPGIVDQDVEPAEALDGTRHQGPAVLLARKVARDRKGARTECGKLGHGRLVLGRIPARHHDRGTGRGEATRDAEPDAAIAARDHGHPARQVEEINRHPAAPLLCAGVEAA
jgi:hypothetical protein